MSLLRIGEILTKPTKLSSTGKPYYIFTGVTFDDGKIEPGKSYTEITSNKNWMEIGKHYYDYLFCRNQVMTWTAVNGWTGLTTEEKEIAAQHFAVGPTQRNEVYTSDEQQQHWTQFIIEAEKTRNRRWHEAKGYISFTLPLIDSIDLGKSTNGLSNEYITYGIESYAKDGVDGLFDWLEGTSEFSGGTGYNGKSYYVSTHKDNIMSILRDGIY
jgi:hypothetical protein